MGRRIDEVIEYWFQERPWEGISPNKIEALVVGKVIELIKTEGVPRPGVPSILGSLRSRNLPMAIASSSSTEIIDAVVETFGIQSYFKQIYSAEHEPHGKPHPGVYVTTASLLDVPTHGCLTFEDSPSGVLAAKAAQMICVAVPDPENKSHPYIQIADAIIDSLGDFDDKLFQFLNAWPSCDRIHGGPPATRAAPVTRAEAADRGRVRPDQPVAPRPAAGCCEGSDSAARVRPGRRRSSADPPRRPVAPDSGSGHGAARARVHRTSVQRLKRAASPWQPNYIRPMPPRPETIRPMTIRPAKICGRGRQLYGQQLGPT